MKIRIVQQVSLVDRPETFKNVFRDFESDVIPHKGDFIADAAFKDPDEYQVHSVSIDYDANLVQVMIYRLELDTEDEEAVGEYILKMKKHGWECNTI